MNANFDRILALHGDEFFDALRELQATHPEQMEELLRYNWQMLRESNLSAEHVKAFGTAHTEQLQRDLDSILWKATTANAHVKNADVRMQNAYGVMTESFERLRGGLNALVALTSAGDTSDDK